MGLLDSVLSAVAHNAQGNNSGGLGDLINQISQNPQLLQIATSLLSNEGGVGGLNGVIAKFQQAGLGDVVASWVGSGHNQAISGDQLGQVLGNDTLAGLARQLGVNPSAAGLGRQAHASRSCPSGWLGQCGGFDGIVGRFAGALIRYLFGSCSRTFYLGHRSI